ncbi:hypothetical protein BS78_02G341800 [Paspalum vaginatum]|nr:hypothetical protein BS78_02G341800 [Paspalum vaginatum]KAJ1291769.1 hypothetical protein BS78_02G341800 [Paspalum vaginatum]KAJ1291770.1 hypothetical protein BS78_02G341800 [Paspalum vaginatum]
MVNSLTTGEFAYSRRAEIFRPLTSQKPSSSENPWEGAASVAKPMASRDFLGGFGREGGAAAGDAGSGGAGESDEVELSLGLSLGGCFGADPAQDPKKPRLQRSSSIASICSLPGDSAAAEEPAAVAAPSADLLRTSSLPSEYMEDRLRRRAMQSQRRLEAKRKRLERRNSMNSGRSASGAGRDEALEQTVPSGFQYRRTVALQRTSSSSLPEQGGGGGGGGSGEAKSPTAGQTSSDNTSGGGGGQSSSRPPTGSVAGRSPNGATGREHPPLRTLRSLTMRTASTGDLRNSMVEDMPMVSYKAEGPSGRKTDGFLYKYRKGEDVRIVCVCHGSFLTPAEFVKHAGGGDVTNPLRHIVVNPQQSVFL